MKILGISRGLIYSPNMVGNDAAIFTAVVDELRALGHEVSTIREEKMTEVNYDKYDRVVTMARNGEMMRKLKEEDTKHFVNSLTGGLMCQSKVVMAQEMERLGIPQPRFKCGHDDTVDYESDSQRMLLPAWLKNSDETAVMADDIKFCATEKDCEKIKRKFRLWGVRAWLLQEHQAGDLVKFYGVEGTDFFHWQYASLGHSKFGLERYNGREKGYAFDVKRMKMYADQLAKSLDVPIYGGDVIIGENGKMWFIDFNDFPSFSSCREKAAKAIATRVVS